MDCRGSSGTDTILIEFLPVGALILSTIRTQIIADNQDGKFKHKELTAKIIEFSVFYRVYTKLGYGFFEDVV
jgi:hypothetical protein